MEFVEKVPVCTPIKLAIDKLMENNYSIKSAKVRDYHFHELSIVFELNNNLLVGSEQLLSQIDGLNYIRKDNVHICNCHWSSIKYIDEHS